MGEYSSNAKNSAFKEARLQDIKIDGGDYVQSASSDLTIPQNDAIDVYDISSEYSNEEMNEEMTAALQKIEEKLKNGEEFTSEDLAPLVGMMTEEQYDLFIQGLQATYDGYIDYYDGLLNGVDGQEGFADSLKDLNDFIENLKLQNVDPDQLLTLPQFEKEFEKYKNIGNGIHNYKELLAYQQELTQAVSLCQQQLNDYTNKKTSAPYDYLYFTKEFMNYEYEDHSEEYEEDLKKSISSKQGYSAQGGTAGAAYSKEIYSYEKFKKMHPDVTPLQYVRLVEKNVPTGIDYDIEGVEDVKNLKQLAHIYNERPEFGKMYEFLYQQDPAKAKDYMKGVKYQTNSVEGAVMAKEFQEDLQKFNDMNHLSEALSNELGVHIQGLKDGVITFEEGSENAIEALLTGMKKVSGDGDADGNRVMSVEEYKRMYILESLLSTEQKEKAGLITKDANGKYVNTDPNSIIDFTKKPKGVLLSNNYELSQGFGNMIPSIATSYICPFLGSTVMGLSAGGNAYHGAMVEGQSYGTSLGYGIFTGASEAITERLLGGLPGLSNKTVTGLNRSYTRAVLSEGVQEGFQGYLDSVARNFLFGEDLPSTPEEAMAYAKDLGKQTVYGCLTALFMQAPHAVRSSMSVNQFNNYLNTNGISTNLSDAAIQSVRDSNPSYASMSNEEIISNFSDAVLTNINDIPKRIQERYNCDAETAQAIIDNNLGVVNSANLAKLIQEGSSLSDALEVINGTNNQQSGTEEINDSASYTQTQSSDNMESLTDEVESTNLSEKEEYINNQSDEIIEEGNKEVNFKELSPSEALEYLSNPNYDFQITDLTSEQASALLKDGAFSYMNVAELCHNGILSIQETLDYVNEGYNSKTLSDNEIYEMFADLVGENLASWRPKKYVAKDLYVKLLSACQEANFGIKDLQKSLDVMEAMEDYYLKAALNQVETGGGIFSTYRTHGIVHVIDVLTESINAYSAVTKAGIKNLDLDTITLAAVMHDTGMSGGKQIVLSVDANNKLVINTREAQSNGTTIRESHSFNSGNIIIENAEALQKAGYSNAQIAEAAILAFAHSKSNSGLNPLLNNSEGWSFAINALKDATKDCDFKIVDELIKAGIILNDGQMTTTKKPIEVKCPKTYQEENGKLVLDSKGKPSVNGGGKKAGLVDTYEFNNDVLSTLATESLILRIGDAITNNDHALLNQYLGEITFNSTDYSNQRDASQVLERLLEQEYFKNKEGKPINPTENGIIAALLGEKDGLQDAAFAESRVEKRNPDGSIVVDENGKIVYDDASSVLFEVDGKIRNDSQPFVLGENNQTYSVDSPGEGVLNVTVDVKNSEAVPFATLFAIQERAGELLSYAKDKGDSDLDINLIVNIDPNTSEGIKNLYKQYQNFYNSQWINVTVNGL